MHLRGERVSVGDTDLFVAEAGLPDGYPMFVLHGGPGLDHHTFGDYLDALGARGYRLLFVDQRGQGASGPSDPATWTISAMAEDVRRLGRSLSLERYAVLGYSFGALVALQDAVDAPGAASQTVISAGIPSARFLAGVNDQLAAFEPMELREQVAASWAAEANVKTEEEFAAILRDQLPFLFADPVDPRIVDYIRRSGGGRYAPEVLRALSGDYGAIEVEDRLGEITQPTLVLAGRHDRVCPVEAAELMAAKILHAELVVFEQSGHMMFVEEPDRYVEVVDEFLRRHR
ncbi:MAG TPA: alpha/beta fold hydrolase [Actinomycetota bacterium]|nr:alpha/beta fold hydrolase [Actinomycetota bacterium]